VGEVKAALLSVWPSGKISTMESNLQWLWWLCCNILTLALYDVPLFCFLCFLCPYLPDIQACSGGDHLRLVCMGKGYLMPDTRTLEDCQIPVFKTHPTPINVSVRPVGDSADDGKVKKKKDDSRGSGAASVPASHVAGGAVADQGCGCLIL
jgi:hypothetical protein